MNRVERGSTARIPGVMQCRNVSGSFESPRRNVKA